MCSSDLPGDEAVWIAISLAAAYFFATRSHDSHRSSAAVVLAAIATNGFWGPLFFSLIAPWMVGFETAVVAVVLHAGGYLTAHLGNQLIVGHGDLEVLSGCSSFNNISLALLVWVSLTKLMRPYWLRTDRWFAAACVAVTFLSNTGRLLLLAFNANDAARFFYWHGGTGQKIFATALSFTVAVIAAAGGSPKAA